MDILSDDIKSLSKTLSTKKSALSQVLQKLDKLKGNSKEEEITTLKDNFQKELAKREYYEKPSAKRKRVKATGVKKGQKLLREKIMRGEAMPPATVGQKHLKGKRSLNKYRATKRLMQQRDWARK